MGARDDAEGREGLLQVQNARHKLEGRHPSDILIAELTPKHSGSKHWAALQVEYQSIALPCFVL